MGVLINRLGNGLAGFTETKHVPQLGSGNATCKHLPKRNESRRLAKGVNKNSHHSFLLQLPRTETLLPTDCGPDTERGPGQSLKYYTAMKKNRFRGRSVWGGSHSHDAEQKKADRSAKALCGSIGISPGWRQPTWGLKVCRAVTLGRLLTGTGPGGLLLGCWDFLYLDR